MLPLVAAALFSLDAMARVVTLSDAAIAGDGTRIAFVAEHAVLEKNEYRGQLWIYDRRMRRQQLLDAAHDSYATPQWSPNGGSLAFVADDGGTHADQLFVRNLATGTTRRLTSGNTDVANFAWQPDGRAIAFTRADAAPVKHGSAAYEDAFEVTDNAYLVTAATQPTHLWLCDVRGGTRRLTHGRWSVADTAVSWSPDGSQLLYVRVPDGIRGSDEHSAAYVLDLASGTSRALTTHATDEDQALWSPDGTQVLYLYPRDGDPANATTVMALPAQGGEERDLARAFDRHVDTAAWMPDSRALLMKVYDTTAGPLVEQPLHGNARTLALGAVVDASIGPVQSVARDGTIAFVGTEAHRANELYVLARDAASPQRLTDFNASTAALHLGRVATVRWNVEGFDEAGVLTYPPNYIAGRRYPLVLRIHGGPTETSEAMFEPFYQLAAAHGYLVFAPNYRGSSNFGSAFERAIFNDASEGPGRDIMAGIAAVEALGIVDQTRIGVSGWSYGGQLTSWMIGHYQIWKCAVTGAAVNDLVVDYTIADDLDAYRQAFSDSPFAANELSVWQHQSPLSYFKDIHTPLLLLGNVYDVRVPIVEQYEMFHALRDNGVPVEFYAYPSGGHLPRGPVRLADAYRRWLGWFDHYLQP
ncbi:MAG: S9 family peptidase [Candidatus Eremiobacteraeota bacterium]|nr:S9 family peptidase [Candidatus Eremiobacteraeota bacterium]